ncbi:MAG: electron transfer flavoprotein subunit beta/FixA family protein [Eubacteriales bacterium]|nr:electron transfer flavoprotein subunit beta/FixA family protein [Eubacteriales bacterium]
MEIIVCVKQVPGTSEVEVDPVTGVLKRDGVASKMNPYDLFALEAAFALTEQYGGTVQTLTMGPPQAKDVLLETLYMGAERGTVLSDRKFAGADVAATSYTIKCGIENIGAYDLILCGKQTTDGDTAQVGPEMAARLGLEHASNVLSIQEVKDGYITVIVDLEDRRQTQRMELPCLLCMEKDANTPRLPSYKRKCKVQPAQLRTCSAADLGTLDENKCGLKGSPTQVERIFPPKKNTDKTLHTGTPEALSNILCEALAARKLL